MLEILLIVVTVIAIAIATLLLVASRQPDTFVLQRSARIAAAPERIYPLISNLQQMNRWNPFLKADPAMTIVHSGPDSGKGAAQEWDGNRQVGAGRVEITEALQPARVAMNLDMTRPFACHNKVEFTLVPRDGATLVTWAMSGPCPLISKVMGLLFSMDRMVGAQFDRGLADLKAIAEA